MSHKEKSPMNIDLSTYVAILFGDIYLSIVARKYRAGILLWLPHHMVVVHLTETTYTNASQVSFSADC